MREVEVILIWHDGKSNQQEKIKVNLPEVSYKFPSLIKHKDHYYSFSPFNFGFDPVYYTRVTWFLDLDKAKDESLEEVLSKE